MTLLPDRFNDAFGDCGWIISEAMNFEVAAACVVKAESGDVDGAEPDLIDTMTLGVWRAASFFTSAPLPAGAVRRARAEPDGAALLTVTGNS